MAVRKNGAIVSALIASTENVQVGIAALNDALRGARPEVDCWGKPQISLADGEKVNLDALVAAFCRRAQYHYDFPEISSDDRREGPQAIAKFREIYAITDAMTYAVKRTSWWSWLCVLVGRVFENFLACIGMGSPRNLLETDPKLGCAFQCYSVESFRNQFGREPDRTREHCESGPPVRWIVPPEGVRYIR